LESTTRFNSIQYQELPNGLKFEVDAGQMPAIVGGFVVLLFMAFFAFMAAGEGLPWFAWAFMGLSCGLATYGIAVAANNECSITVTDEGLALYYGPFPPLTFWPLFRSRVIPLDDVKRLYCKQKIYKRRTLHRSQELGAAGLDRASGRYMLMLQSKTEGHVPLISSILEPQALLFVKDKINAYINAEEGPLFVALQPDEEIYSKKEDIRDKLL